MSNPLSKEERLAAARAQAIEQFGHRCTCDHSDHRQHAYHQEQMAILFKKMEEFEEAALIQYGEEELLNIAARNKKEK
jgi:hypothetical protein